MHHKRDSLLTYLLLGDIHANLPALEAVLADMDTRGCTNRYCLGDLVGYGTFPNLEYGVDLGGSGTRGSSEPSSKLY